MVLPDQMLGGLPFTCTVAALAVSTLQMAFAEPLAKLTSRPPGPDARALRGRRAQRASLTVGNGIPGLYLTFADGAWALPTAGTLGALTNVVCPR